VCADPDDESTVSGSGANQSQPITPRRREYAGRNASNTIRAVHTHTIASGDSIRNAPEELVSFLPQERGDNADSDLHRIQLATQDRSTHRTNNEQKIKTHAKTLEGMEWNVQGPATNEGQSVFKTWGYCT